MDVRPRACDAILTVSDAGAGVPESDRERIFSPFFRTGAAAAGTGLGLTLVRQIARQHGGDAAWVGTTARPSAIAVSLPALPTRNSA